MEDRKAELALEFAQGKRTILECEDVFEGMQPQVRYRPGFAAFTWVILWAHIARRFYIASCACQRVCW